MALFDSQARPKNPGKVAGGKKGAASRWGAPRLVRLDELNGPQRAVVLALIETMKAPAAVETPAGATTGGTRDALDQI
jgi:hypothetical protein